MQVPVRNIAGETVEDIELNDNIFAIEPNKAVMHQALVRQLANARQGTHNSQTRGEVTGTTAKWFRQKGTGRARHGSRKAPIFVGQIRLWCWMICNFRYLKPEKLWKYWITCKLMAAPWFCWQNVMKTLKRVSVICPM